MKSHIDIKIDGKSLTLPDDFKLNIEEQNPLFNDTEMFSYPVEIPMDGNRDLLKNIDDVNSDLRPVDNDFIDGKNAEIHVEGIPFRVGTAVVSEDEEMKDKLSLNIDAADRSFSELISNLKCRDIPLKDEIVIGEKIGGISINSYLKMQYGVLREHLVSSDNGTTWGNRVPSCTNPPDGSVTDSNSVDGGKYSVDLSTDITLETPKKVDLSITPQALGFSYPGLCVELTNHEAKVETGKVISYSAQGKTYNVNKPTVNRSFINISQEYGSTTPTGSSEAGSMNTNGETIPWYYCNSRVCYTHYDEEKQDEKITGTNDYKYETSSNTVAKEALDSSPEAKWPYWVLDADRQQSGICFYVLYFLDCLFHSLGVEFDKSELLQIEDFKHLCFFTTKCKFKEEHYYDADGNIDENYNLKDIALVNKWAESRGSGGSLTVTIDPNDKTVNSVPISYFQMYLTYDMFKGGDSLSDGISAGDILSYEDGYTIFPDRIEKQVAHSVFERYTPYDQTLTASIVKMVATSENFPNESVSTIISSLEASFGIKFYYDYEQHKVTAYLKRSIFRNQESVLTLNGQLIQTYKLSEKITGYRMKYSTESDSTEQKDNIRDSVKDYNTSYDYIDYPQEKCVTDEVYADFCRSAIQPSNLHIYIDQNTGNRYRVKVSSEAKGVSDLAPVLFEVAQFKGVEYGDCSEKNSDYIKEDVSSFQPIEFNDVNYQQELKSSRQNGVVSAPQIYAAYIDEDMEHEFITQEVDNIASNEGVQLLLKETLNLIESYDPSKQDDGNSPLQSHDWGIAIAMMRGGGADSTIQQFDSGYDGFGNSKWRFTGGQYVMHPDTMDAVGNLFDYNGNTSGIGGGERFSLKIRSWVQPDWADSPLCVQDINNMDAKIRTRGLFDTFMREWAYFLVHRKKYRSKMLIEAAQLSDIKNHWMSLWNINGKLAYIDKVSYGISVGNGVDEVTIDYYAI